MRAQNVLPVCWSSLLHFHRRLQYCPQRACEATGGRMLGYALLQFQDCPEAKTGYVSMPIAMQFLHLVAFYILGKGAHQ